MRDILLIYRGRVFDTEIKPRLEQFKDDIITLVTENKLTRNLVSHLIKDYKQKINLITIDEFLDDNIITKFMKFKAALGNPPYQNNESESDAGKLYIDITKKTMDILDDDGIIDFHTPDTLVRDGRNKFTVKKQGLRSVDYTANESFNEGVTIVNWIYDKSYKGDDVEVTNKDKSVDIRKYTDSMVDKNDLIGIKLFEKIKEGKSKLFTSGQRANKNKDTKDEIYKYKVHMNWFKNKVAYTDEPPILFGKKKIFISISKSYTEDNFNISNDDFGQLQLMIDITDYTDEQINNIKQFLFHPICVNICNKYKTLYGTGFNNMLYTFPEIDINKRYTQEDIIKLFKLTDVEVSYLLND